MSSSRNVHALLLLMTLIGFGVAAVVIAVKPKGRKDEVSTATPGPVAPASPGPGPGLERPPPAPAGSGPASKAPFVSAAAVVIPPQLALKFEKQYRDLPPSALELAHQKLTEALAVETRKHAPEDSLVALRREIAWLAERLPREE